MESTNISNKGRSSVKQIFKTLNDLSNNVDKHEDSNSQIDIRTFQLDILTMKILGQYSFDYFMKGVLLNRQSLGRRSRISY